jgi:NADH:ubiquinone oxidoreductase subunit K
MTPARSTQEERVRRAGYALSAAAVLSILFILAPSTDAVRFVTISPVVAVVLLVVGVVGVLAARTGQAALYLVAGGLALVAALLQLVQFGQSTNWLAGNGSTAALLAGLGIGFCALGYATRPSSNPDQDSATTPRRDQTNSSSATRTPTDRTP